MEGREREEARTDGGANDNAHVGEFDKARSEEEPHGTTRVEVELRHLLLRNGQVEHVELRERPQQRQRRVSRDARHHRHLRSTEHAVGEGVRRREGRSDRDALLDGADGAVHSEHNAEAIVTGDREELTLQADRQLIGTIGS